MCDIVCEIHAKKGQNMTSVLIENVKNKFVPVFMALAKAENGEFKVLQKDKKSAKSKKSKTKNKFHKGGEN